MTKSEGNLLSMEHYVRKTFFKTASLMANSCRAVAILGGGDDVVSQAAWDYGRNLGLAFQVTATPGVQTSRQYASDHVQDALRYCATQALGRGFRFPGM
jgi:phage terminase large subunit GpA-like protein